MYCISTLNTHGKPGGFAWQKGQTGASARQLRLDAPKHGGEVSGYVGFNGLPGTKSSKGVVFWSRKDRDSFLIEFGGAYNSKIKSNRLEAGINTRDIDF
jgi:hypothetical protein